MKKKVQRVVVILLAAAMLLSLLLPVFSMLAGAVTQDDINSIRNQLNEIANQKKEVEQQLAAIRGDLEKAKEQIDLIQGRITLTEHQIYESQMLLDQYDSNIAEKEAEIAALEEQERQQYEEFYAQVRWMEETGEVSYLSILFRASSFSEMLDYAMLISDIMEYSNRIIDDLELTQAQLGEARDALQEDRDAQAVVQSELEGQRAELTAQKQEATELLNEIAESESKYAKEARQLADDEAAIDKQLKDAERKYAEQLAAMNYTGDWYWPLPGRYRLSSLFGGRPDPFTGRPDNHTGTDIPAPQGTEIHAAQGGIVTFVSPNKNSSYGYYCIIGHGNGYSTLYAHMNSKAIVQEGQSVSKGQVIGYVGTTGRSTGYHLHFELRVNGTRGDVLKLYPGLTFTSPKGASIPGG